MSELTFLSWDVPCRRQKPFGCLLYLVMLKARLISKPSSPRLSIGTAGDLHHLCSGCGWHREMKFGSMLHCYSPSARLVPDRMFTDN